MIKVRIKEEFRNKKIYIGGSQYDFSNKTDEQLLLIWEQNPEFRIFLEEIIHLEDDTILNTTEFEEMMAKVGITTGAVAARKLVEFKKKNNRK